MEEAVPVGAFGLADASVGYGGGEEVVDFAVACLLCGLAQLVALLGEGLVLLAQGGQLLTHLRQLLVFLIWHSGLVLIVI